MLSAILKSQADGKDEHWAEYSYQAVSQYVNVLVSIGERVGRLKETDKETYYSEVKNLIKIIKAK